VSEIAVGATHHAIVGWVNAQPSNGEPIGCRGEVDDSGGNSGFVTAIRRDASGSESYLGGTTIGAPFAAAQGFRLVARNHVAASAERLTVRGSLASATATVTASAACATAGDRVAFGTRSVSAGFDALMVADDAPGCTPGVACACPPPPEM
jgi:hypothetical protein